MVERLIVYLTAIAGLSKDIHYQSRGENFYSIHLLMDRIYDGLYDLIDEIQEKYFMYNGKSAITSKNAFEGAGALLDDGWSLEEKENKLYELLKDCIYIADEISAEKTIDCGDNDLLGRISSKLHTGVALLGRMLEK